MDLVGELKKKESILLFCSFIITNHTRHFLEPKKRKEIEERTEEHLLLSSDSHSSAAQLSVRHLELNISRSVSSPRGPSNLPTRQSHFSYSTTKEHKSTIVMETSRITRFRARSYERCSSACIIKTECRRRGSTTVVRHTVERLVTYENFLESHITIADYKLFLLLVRNFT